MLAATAVYYGTVVLKYYVLPAAGLAHVPCAALSLPASAQAARLDGVSTRQFILL